MLVQNNHIIQSDPQNLENHNFIISLMSMTRIMLHYSALKPQNIIDLVLKFLIYIYIYIFYET